jgi:hypothetical protein
VGYKIDSFGGLDYKLSTTKLDKTQLLVSDDKGVTWKPSGVFPTANWPPAWRRHLVPGSSNKVAVGIDRSFLLGTPNASGSYTFASPVAAAPNAGPWGFDDATFGKNPNNVGCAPGKSPCSVSTNMFGHTVIARVPASNQYVVTFPTTIAGKGHGFRMLFYDAGGQFVGEGNPVVPKSASLDNFVFHLAAVDHGSGPVLLYWSDVDSAAKTATVRGRFVTGPAAYTSDFQIAASFKNTLDGKKFVFARSFSVNTPYWYGDYRTASGFSWPVSPMLRPSLFIYYPSWVEPDASIRYTRVEYSVLGSAALRERDSEGTRVRMLAAKRAPDHGSSGKSAAGQTTQPASRASGPPETRRKTP